MTTEEFNEKYSDHLEYRHYGMAIGTPEVIEYMDQEFEKEIAENPDFEYAQIKLKFGTARVYTNASHEKNMKWEDMIDRLVGE